MHMKIACFSCNTLSHIRQTEDSCWCDLTLKLPRKCCISWCCSEAWMLFRAEDPRGKNLAFWPEFSIQPSALWNLSAYPASTVFFSNWSCSHIPWEACYKHSSLFTPYELICNHRSQGISHTGMRNSYCFSRVSLGSLWSPEVVSLYPQH